MPPVSIFGSVSKLAKYFAPFRPPPRNRKIYLALPPRSEFDLAPPESLKIQRKVERRSGKSPKPPEVDLPLFDLCLRNLCAVPVQGPFTGKRTLKP